MLKIMDKIAWVKDEDEYLMTNYETGKVSLINGTGAEILDCIISGMDEPTIVLELAQKYNVHENDIRNDIISFINELISKKYLERKE